jgi:hypothetical protein
MLSRDAEALPIEAPLADFARDGWARIGLALDDEGLTALRARTDDLMLGRVRHEGLFFQHDSESGRYEDLVLGEGWRGPSLDYRKIEKVERDPLFLAWIENPLFERVARAVIGDEIVLYRAVIWTKGGRGGGTELPYHQDGGTFWGLDRDPILQIWTALDDAPIEAGCVEVLPGSHHAGLATPLGGVVPDEVLEKANARACTIAVPARAGEVLLIHNHVWHCSGRNRTALPRRALSVCYMSAATRCMRKKRAPRTFVPLFRGRGGG